MLTSLPADACQAPSRSSSTKLPHENPSIPWASNPVPGSCPVLCWMLSMLDMHGLGYIHLCAEGQPKGQSRKETQLFLLIKYPISGQEPLNLGPDPKVIEVNLKTPCPRSLKVIRHLSSTDFTRLWIRSLVLDLNFLNHLSRGCRIGLQDSPSSVSIFKR